jgi:hypothetical protein
METQENQVTGFLKLYGIADPLLKVVFGAILAILTYAYYTTDSARTMGQRLNVIEKQQENMVTRDVWDVYNKGLDKRLDRMESTMDKIDRNTSK